MIGKLTGIAEQYSNDSIILNVSNVGYIVCCSEKTLQHVKYDSSVTLFIDMQTKEDGTHLYGFETLIEKQCFKLLNSVSGVGGKVALLILSRLSIKHILDAIRFGHASVFQSISGIGPKLAQRITTELKNSKGAQGLTLLLSSEKSSTKAEETQDKTEKKVKKSRSSKKQLADSQNNENHNENDNSANIFEDAISAVINLGFNKAQVHEAAYKILGVDEISDMKLDDAIRKLLASVSNTKFS